MRSSLLKVISRIMVVLLIGEGGWTEGGEVRNYPVAQLAEPPA